MSAPPIFTKQGVRYRCFETYPSRRSDGKVHLQAWRREIKEWVLLCSPNDTGPFSGYYGHVAEIAPATCKKCQKRDPRCTS